MLGQSEARRSCARDPALPFASSRSSSLLSKFVCVALAGGLTGFKNCTSTCIQTFAVASLISITWLMFGYSLAFGYNWDGTKNDFIGGANMFWFWGDGKGIPSFPA
jgi:ammonia channel protein AmtB